MSNRRKTQTTAQTSEKSFLARTADSFQNFLTRVGIGTGNANDGSTYGFNPISRNRTKLEWMYRGSWICRAGVDAIAEDMTREGVEVRSDEKPEAQQELEKEAKRLQIWSKIEETIKWSRLYGGAIGVLLIDGQQVTTPLRAETVKKGQFKGIAVLDRWQLQPSFNDLITELGPDLGKPKYYRVINTSAVLANQNIHYSRVVRLDGADVPFNQLQSENYWAISVLEPLYDRLIAFDSTTSGAAQLVYKAHLRTYKVKNLREIIATGNKPLEGLLAQISMMRAMQSNEGITLMDLEDEFETHQYTFSGLDNVLLQFGQQISGALAIPLVRLFGQSPAGLNSTGESDLTNYYDGIKQKQESRLRPSIEVIYALLYRSLFGTEPPKSFAIHFRPLWQMSDEQRATVTSLRTTAVVSAYEAQLIDRSTGMRELKQISEVTGAFSNIDDKAIKDAEADPAPSPEALGLELPVKNDGPEAQGAEGSDQNGEG
jgi:phage-related protein (TIGR01555 family)